MRIYRASSLGYSLEQMVAPHLGYTPIAPPEVIQRAFDEGHRLEPIVIDMLLARGWEIRTRQDELNSVGDYQIECELEVISGVAKVVGHLDGDSLVGVVEVKSMAHEAWLQFRKHEWDTPGLIQKYKWQASAYMLATGLRHQMVAYDKQTGELHIVGTDEPFYSISDIANKLQAAEHYITAGELPDDCNDFPCSYFYLHPAKEVVGVATADEELESILSAWLTADKAEKAYKKEKDALREQILSLATDELTAGKIKGACGVSVTTTWVEEQYVGYTKKAHWETRVQGPKNAKP